MASWDFLKDGAGILPASNMADPLRGTNLAATEVLVREAVQNSLDERRSDIDRPVRIRFDRRVITGDDKLRFVENLQLSTLSARRRGFRGSHNWFSDGNAVFDRLEDPAVGLPILSISDFGANGLGGRWNRRGSKEDRFFNLVLSIGGSRKWEDEEDSDAIHYLGSYGYGKMAFAMCSDIRVVAYYSTFRQDEASSATCRAMASAFLPPHSEDGVDYAGQAYFGDDTDEDRNPRMPLVDDQAHAWIRTLGLTERSPEEDTGTTIVIPAARASISDIVKSCETWWWPRMRDPDLIRRVMFEFIDEGQRVDGCNPRSRMELSPFIDCYKLTVTGKTGEGYEARTVQVRPEGKPRDAGRLVLKAVNPAVLDHDHGESFTNRVALVRDGLVIKYENGFAHEDKPPVVGVFVPDENSETHQAFVFSEPPSHDDWIENSDRLLGRYTWGREFLRLTKNRLRSLTRDFQTRQTPPADTETTNAAAFLRRTLGQLFKVPKEKAPSPVPPSPRRRAFTITTRESGRRPCGAGQEDFAAFRIGLSEHAPEEAVTVDVVISLKTLADVDASPGDSVPCRVDAPGGAHSGNENTVFSVELRRDEEVEVLACGDVHPLWKTQWEVSIVRRNDQS